MTTSFYAWASGYAGFLALCMVVPRLLARNLADTPADLQYVVGLYGSVGFLALVVTTFVLLALAHLGWLGFGLHGETLAPRQALLHLSLPAVTVLATSLLFFGLPFQRTIQTLNPDATGPDGHSLLFSIVAEGDMRALERMIARGADVNTQGFAGGTPILAAALAHRWEVAHVLLDHGARIDVHDDTGLTLPNLAAASRIPESDPRRAALGAMKDRFEAAGISHWVHYPPATTQAMLEDGTWPPPPPDSMAMEDLLYSILPRDLEVAEAEIRSILAALESARLAHNARSPAYRQVRPLADHALQLVFGSEEDAKDAESSRNGERSSDAADAIVTIQGLPRAFADTEGWASGRIRVLDGGPDFFRAEYDRHAGRIRTFIVHGEA